MSEKSNEVKKKSERWYKGEKKREKGRKNNQCGKVGKGETKKKERLCKG